MKPSRILFLLLASLAPLWAQVQDDVAPVAPVAANPDAPVHVEPSDVDVDEADVPSAPAAPVVPAPSEHVDDTPHVDEAPAAVDKPREIDALPPESNDGEERHFRHDSRPSIGGETYVRKQDSVDHAVAIFGDTRIDGTVRNEAVAVMGDVIVNGHVHGSATAVMGDVILGPGSRVDGQVVAVMGKVVRAEGVPAPENTVEVMSFLSALPSFSTLQVWFSEAVLRGRLLTLNEESLWAWAVFAGFTALYLFLAAAFARPLGKCASTLEVTPGLVLVCSFLALLLKPLITVVLTVTLIGGPLFVLFCKVVGIIGKGAFLIWMGRRMGITNALGGVLASAAILAGLYVVPFVGLMTYVVTDFIGFGMVICALVNVSRKRSAERDANRAAMLAQTAPVAGAASASTPPPFIPSAPAPENRFASTEPAAATTPSPGSVPSHAVPPTAFPPPPFIPSVAPTPVGETSALAARRAGFLIRLGASAIDAIVVSLLAGLTSLGEYWLPLFAVYCVVLWGLRGATLGGIILNLRVINIHGKPLDWTTCVVRGLGGFLSLFAIGLGFLWVLWDSEMQSWHDKIAGTVIVYGDGRQKLL